MTPEHKTVRPEPDVRCFLLHGNETRTAARLDSVRNSPCCLPCETCSSDAVLFRQTTEQKKKKKGPMPSETPTYGNESRHDILPKLHTRQVANVAEADGQQDANPYLKLRYAFATCSTQIRVYVGVRHLECFPSPAKGKTKQEKEGAKGKRDGRVRTRRTTMMGKGAGPVIIRMLSSQ